MEDKHANKKRRQIIPVVCVYMFVCTPARLFLFFLLICLFPSLSVLLFSYMAPIYLPISLSPFFLFLFLPCLPLLSLHHTSSSAPSPTCLSVAPSKEGTEEHRGVCSQTQTHTPTSVHKYTSAHTNKKTHEYSCKEMQDGAARALVFGACTHTHTSKLTKL